MLDFDRGRSFNSQHQGSRLRRRTPHGRGQWIFPAREWAAISAPTMSGPAGHQFDRGEALFGERLVERLVQKLCQRTRLRSGRACSRWRLCHIGRMTLAAGARSSESVPRRRTATAAAADLLPGITATAACCLAGGAAAKARPLSGVALRDHAAADHREGGGALFRALHARWPDVRRWRRRRSRTCSAVGGAWLLRARTKSPCLRQGGGRTPRRTIPAERSRARRAAGHRPLHRGGHRGDRVRGARGAGRRQRRAGGGKTIRRRGGTARGKDPNPAACRNN